ncbi:hypothetical protein GCM10009801_65760 [Streptomyces albiaxialis]|uniref:DUF1266 domain-containing protein n=1 Tax=Streptomyces albiaxialis TaxID=329523 RepID=A0ABP5I8W5_9ACTN
MLLRKLPFLPGVGKRLRADRAAGERDPEVLRGLACGAHLAYANGDAWNTVVDPSPSPKWERTRLKATWGVTSREGWRETQELLLDGEISTFGWDLALDVREELAAPSGAHDPYGAYGAYGGAVSGAAWAEGIARTLRERLGPGAADGPAEALAKEAARVPRYEERFRADGLLAAGARVRRTLAWDLGRAANMACWGVNAGFAHADEARAALRSAGELARKAYGSWAEFSTAYVLGRCLHFDEDTLGSWYREVRDSHRLLTRHPESPWTARELHDGPYGGPTDPNGGPNGGPYGEGPYGGGPYGSSGGGASGHGR